MDKIIDVEDIINNHMLKQVGNIMLTNYQMEVLRKYAIDFNGITNLNELMSNIDNKLGELDDEEYDELDNIYKEISERNYYENTNK